MTRSPSLMALAAGLLLLAPSAWADAPKATVVLTGTKTGNVKSESVNGVTTVTLELALDKDTTVTVLTRDAKVVQKFLDASEQRIKELEKQSRELAKQLDDAISKQDVEKAKKLTDELNRHTEAIKAVVQKQPAVAEGALAYKDKKWVLTGTVRPFEPDGQDKGTKLGTCTVRAEVVGGDFKAGGVTSKLALRCGDVTVVLTGPAAKGEFKGLVEATGTLRLTKAGEAILDTTKIDAAKK
jgi:hypothetical protein